MKKLLFGFLILLFLAIPVFGYTADLSKSLTFAWEQENPEYITGWSLHWTPTTGAGYVKVADIPYTTGAGPKFTSSTVLNVTGAPGGYGEQIFCPDGEREEWDKLSLLQRSHLRIRNPLPDAERAV